MPCYIFDCQQIRAALQLLDLERVADGSPLTRWAETDRRLHPDDPRFQYLLDQRLIEPRGDGWRVNKLFAGALLAAAHPNEIIRVAVDDPQHPGFVLVRRGPLWCECTVGHGGATKLSFPLTRSTVILTLMGALSGDAPEAEPTGFHFVGPAGDAFVLSTAARLWRECPMDMSLEQFRIQVMDAAAAPAFVGPFAAVAGPEPIARLAKSVAEVEKAVSKLAAAGHLEIRDSRLRPSIAAQAALGDFPRARFSVTRTVVGPDGPRSHTLAVIKTGDRKLVFRLCSTANGLPRFEWTEMNRRQIRSIIAAMLVPEELLAQASAPTPAAEPAPPPRLPEPRLAQERPLDPTPKPTRALTCASCGAPLQPKHRFCPRCGAAVQEPQPLTCPNSDCRRPLRQGAKFCAACGTKAA